MNVSLQSGQQIQIGVALVFLWFLMGLDEAFGKLAATVQIKFAVGFDSDWFRFISVCLKWEYFIILDWMSEMYQFCRFTFDPMP